MAEEEVNPEFAPFWSHVAAGRVAFPRCSDCGRFHWYPMRWCPTCLSQRIEWIPVKGEGEIYSWTVVRYPFAPKYADKVPYVVGLVEFPDAPGVRLLTNLVGDRAAEVDWRCGMAVRPVFPAAGAGEPERVVFEAS